MEISAQGDKENPVSTNTDLFSVTTASKLNKNIKYKQYVLPLVIILSIIVLSGISYFILGGLKKTKEVAYIVTPTSDPTPTPYIGTSEMFLRSNVKDTSYAIVKRIKTLNFTSHSVTATLKDPSPTHIYQVWIKKENAKPISVGILEKNSEGKYVLEAKYNLDKPSTAIFEQLYNTYLISEESENDENIENIILEGTFLQ